MTDAVLDVDVRRILDRVLQTSDPIAVEHPPQGNHKATTVVRYADRADVVVQSTGDPTAAHAEAAVLAAVQERTSVPVPRLLGRGSIGDRGYLVTEYVHGRDLHETFTTLDDATRAEVARLFGDSLAELHEAFTFGAAGPVTVGSSGTLEADGPDPATFFEAYAADALDALPAAFDDRRSQVETALASRPKRTVTPRLFPWDLRPGNAVFADGEVAAIVDWGEPLAAAPGLAVAKTQHLVAAWYESDPAALRDAFEAGYESVRPLPDVTTADRVAAVVASAVDSTGTVTRPRYPELTGADAVAVHRDWLDEWLPA